MIKGNGVKEKGKIFRFSLAYSQNYFNGQISYFVLQYTTNVYITQKIFLIDSLKCYQPIMVKHLSTFYNAVSSCRV